MLLSSAANANTQNIHHLICQPAWSKKSCNVTWQLQAAKNLQRATASGWNSPHPTGYILTHAFITDLKLPKKLSGQSKLVTQFHLFLVAIPTEENPERQSYSLQAACSAHVAQLQSDHFSKTEVCRDFKVGFSCEPYIQNCSKHLRRNINILPNLGQDLIGFIRTGIHQGIARHDMSDVQPSSIELGPASCSV